MAFTSITDFKSKDQVLKIMIFLKKNRFCEELEMEFYLYYGLQIHRLIYLPLLLLQI